MKKFVFLLALTGCYEPCGGASYEYLSEETGVCISETNQEFHDLGWSYEDIDFAVNVAINSFLSYHYIEDKSNVVERLASNGARLQFFDELHDNGKEVLGLTSGYAVAVSTNGSFDLQGNYRPMELWNNAVHHEVLHVL